MNVRIEPKLNTTDCQAQAAKGFTLLEVLIAITIIAIISALGVPAMQQWLNDGAVKNGAHSLMFHMKEARVTAMAESRKVFLTFDAYSYTYDADTTPLGTCTRCKKINVPFNQFSSSMLMVKKGTTNVVPANVSFSSQGTASNTTVDVICNGSINRVVVNIIGRAYMCNQSQITSNLCL